MSQYARRRFDAVEPVAASFGSLAGCPSDDAGHGTGSVDGPGAQVSSSVFAVAASEGAGETATAESLRKPFEA
ncbi:MULTISPECIES: hypothetical protein [unclassified Haloferax]|jgi:zinc transport system substrate-binding protein|uniref:hypothetical protein n=1 Tax=unclassified Haloferax TaxID=2625095 RepID=UPI000E247910|nr:MULTISPECIES: hypothetical protein [unclassified Haloferax]RDZ33977.1 hypothetical protein C5B88_15070 [Haloferax sp. Atlit-24N]RDZ35702.1 hypothetical protein C5B89_18490 [Haloferax sp. Atlit-47N]RLM33583.1 hypothetical protein DVK03_18140 [Haloferax sp. Atlit-109R]RLM40839.1 hypothetical protein DVK04_18185 [Haloferax sp. Atlit-105R]